MTPAEKMAKQKLAEKKKTPKKPKGVGVPKSQRDQVWSTKLVELRAELGLSQLDVAAVAGMTASAFAYCERGLGVNLATAFKVARFFGKTIEEIWTPLEE